MKCRCLTVGGIIVLVFSCSGIASSAFGESADIPADTVKVDPNIAGARIEFDSVVHDFGQIAPGTENICKFTFKNTGSEVLKIEKVTKTCGCTPFELEREEYAPGESGELQVKYRHSGRGLGKIRKKLSMHTNDKENPKIGLTVIAKVVERVSFEPSNLHLKLNKENGDCPKLKLTSTDGKPFAVEWFKSTGNCITAEVNPLKRATEHVIDPNVDIDLLEDNLSGKIEILLNHPDCEKVTINFSALAKFRTQPHSISLLNARPGETVNKELLVASSYDEPFEIESVRSRNGLIELKEKKKNGKKYELKLRITPPARKADERTFSDTLVIAIKDEKPIEVLCNGFYPRKNSVTNTIPKSAERIKPDSPALRM